MVGMRLYKAQFNVVFWHTKICQQSEIIYMFLYVKV